MTLTNTTKPHMYAGLLNSGIEFFTVEDEVITFLNGKVLSFTELPFNVIQLLREEIENDISLKMALLDWHSNSEFKRLEQLAKCRFGGLDFKADIIDNKLQEGEYWDCPVRGACAYNGIICQAAKFQGADLSKIDIDLMKMLSTNLTNETIAGELNVPMGTFHKLKKMLYEKLGSIQTKQEVAVIATALNII